MIVTNMRIRLSQLRQIIREEVRMNKLAEELHEYETVSPPSRTDEMDEPLSKGSSREDAWFAARDAEKEKQRRMEKQSEEPVEEEEGYY